MRLTWINGAFPRGRRAPRRSSGLGATADRALHAARDLQETSRGERGKADWEGEEKKEEENDDDDDDDDALPRLAAASLLRGILSRRRDAPPPRAPHECQAGCSGSRRAQSSGRRALLRSM
ncbi:hypothetical protein ALC62_10816 [Cyphomyrmex costatus]|uniref:Uncharacterized protein n=1 Tax=Cyphomyrmex costatus TaxID=456900 RepID=A0A195CCL8_9HYME|nr:hypothetical protein ALC62_10816 [Cyphomyrmex costatus]